MSGQFISQMCALSWEDIQYQYARLQVFKEKWNQAKEVIKIRMGLQGMKVKITFGELGIHRAIWVTWNNKGKEYSRQIGWNPTEDSSDAIKYNWVFNTAREYYKEREYFKKWLGINN